MLANYLDGRARWLMLPSTLGHSMVALVAALYATATFKFPTGSLGTFWFVAVVVGTVGVFIAEWITTAYLQVLRALSSGRLPLTPQNRLRAIAEVRQFPERLARLGVAFWLCAVVLVAVILGFTSPLPIGLLARVVAIGVLFGPMAAVVVGLLVGRRSHRVVERLAEGLSPEAVAKDLTAAPASIQRRLALFTVVMVALPSVVAIDVTRVLGDDLVGNWLASAPGPEREALLEAERSAMILKTLAFIAMAGSLAAIAAWAGGSLLAKPLQQVTEEAGSIAKGRLETATLIAGDGEVWLISSVFARLEERLVGLVTQLATASGRIVSAVETLRLSSGGSEAGAAEQAAALNQTSATTEELAQSARQIASSAASVQELAQSTLRSAESGLENAEAFRAAIDRMRQDNQSIASAVDRLTGRVQQIGRIVDVINTVADRSDLLALSAELEGTRAHEVGRGFSLVALEMRRLAENVLESTAEVEELIGEIRTATRQTALATDRARQLTDGGTALADEVARALTSVAQSARQTSDAVRTISLATQQQQSGTDQLAEAMSDILGVTQQSLATSRQLLDANERLESLSSGLGEVVQRFKKGRA